MKGERQEAILDIVAKKPVETQEQLLDELMRRGITATQATISRDIKELHLVKELTGKGCYRYVPSGPKPIRGELGPFKGMFHEGTVRFEQAQNLVVAKTMPGLAPAAGAALDGMDIDDLVGTLAGDDTVLLVFRREESAQRFCRNVQRILG